MKKRQAKINARREKQALHATARRAAAPKIRCAKARSDDSLGQPYIPLEGSWTARWTDGPHAASR